MGRPLLVAAAIIWAPVSLLVVFIGLIALEGWTSEDGSRRAGALDAATFDNVATAVAAALTYLGVIVFFAFGVRRVSTCSNGAALAVGAAVAIWAPVLVCALLLVD